MNMHTHADKTQENKSQSVANPVYQKKSGDKSTFQFVDNRPEAVAQRKLQEMANNSPQIKQAAQLQAMADNYSFQQEQPIQKKENNTGLPDNLKAGIENLSGYSMDDVKVHRNSDKPAQLQAHAYAQGTDIHLATGQEKHLPHEAWHVVQQKQGRVKPTMQMKGKVNINDDAGLEKEADMMGAKAILNGQPSLSNSQSPVSQLSSQFSTIQMMIGTELVRLNYEWGIPAVQMAIKDLSADSWHDVEYEETLNKLEELNATGVLGPTNSDEVQVKGSNPKTDTARFKLMYNVAVDVVGSLRQGGLTNEDFILGGSYAAALKGNDRPPQDVDIDFLTDESYARGYELISQMNGAIVAKHDPSISSIEFLVDYPIKDKVMKVKIKVELVNIRTKNINKNVKEDLQSIESKTNLHQGARIPTIGAMIINWMDRMIESNTTKVIAEKDKSKKKGDKRSIIIMAKKHNITYDILQNYMKAEDPRYREIWTVCKLN
jgi:hypothetical protein